MNQPVPLVRLEPVTDAALAVYRGAVTERLAQSYTAYQRLPPEKAATLAAQRVTALIAAATAPRGTTRIQAILADGQQVGTVAFSLNLDEGHLFLWDLHVDSGRRRRGHGRAVMHRLEEIARAACLGSLRLNVEAGNPASMAFFTALGCVPISVAMTLAL